MRRWRNGIQGTRKGQYIQLSLPPSWIPNKCRMIYITISNNGMDLLGRQSLISGEQLCRTNCHVTSKSCQERPTGGYKWFGGPNSSFSLPQGTPTIRVLQGITYIFILWIMDETLVYKLQTVFVLRFVNRALSIFNLPFADLFSETSPPNENRFFCGFTWGFVVSTPGRRTKWIHPFLWKFFIASSFTPLYCLFYAALARDIKSRPLFYHVGALLSDAYISHSINILN